VSKAWNQQKDESRQAYTSFLAYRNLPSAERSIRAACGVVYGGSTANVRRLEQWSSQHRWVERAKAWDTEQLRIRDEAEQRAIVKATEKAVAKRDLTKDRVLEEAAAVAFSSLTNAASWTEDDLTLKPSDELPPEVAASIESIELRHDKEGNPIHKIKLHSKVPMLTKLGEHYQLWGKEAGIQSPTANFFQFFLEAGRSGEIEREMKRRGLLPTAPGEVIPDASGEVGEIEAEMNS